MTSTLRGRPLSLTPAGIAGTLLAFLVAAVCVRLGFWQLDRRSERATLNARLEARRSEPAVALASVPRDTAGLMFRRVTIEGRLDQDRSIVLPGRALRGTPGVHIVTPLLLDHGGAVLVNLGWLPSPDAATVDLSALPVLPGTVRIEGLALPLPGAGAARADRAGPGAGLAADTFRRVWYAPDPTALRAQFPYPVGAVLVQALPSPAGPRFPERLEPPPLDPGPHFGYAIQWFSFATVALAGWLLVLLKSRAADTPVAVP
jgi:surfeit locus 1 family protein